MNFLAVKPKCAERTVQNSRIIMYICSLSFSFSSFFLHLLFLHGKNFVKQHDAKVFSKARQMSEVILTPRSTPFYLRFLEALHLQSNQSINVTSATLLLLFFELFFSSFSQLVLSSSYFYCSILLLDLSAIAVFSAS